MSQFDVIVVGGGLVGSALALALGKAGLRLALVEQAAPIVLPTDHSWDVRCYAVTPGNADFFNHLGVWDALDHSRIATIAAMLVWGDDGQSCLELDSYDAGIKALGFIAENRLMQDGLWRELQHTDNIALFPSSRCVALDFSAESARLELEHGAMLEGALVVGADGGNSWVRQQAGIAVEGMPYKQLGIVANFETEKSHNNIARQWFLPEGVLAWLPLPGNRISIVWSAADTHAKSLLALDTAAFCQAVAETGHHALGDLRLITTPAAFPLVLQRNAAMIAPRLALVGDAAHRVHPLAGQGVNLGFRDVRHLSSTLLESNIRDLGDIFLLRRYERARKADVLSMQAVTTGLHKLFKRDNFGLAWLRNNGLAAANHIAPLKRRMIAQAII